MQTPDHVTDLPPGGEVGLRLRLARGVARMLVRRASREALQGRLIDPDAPERGRWLRADVRDFRRATWRRVDALLPAARLGALPSFGNRLNVFMAVVTTAAYRELLDRGVAPDYAMTLVADLGWKIYAWMLGAAALPARLLTRTRQRQLERTLALLMRFPFSAPGRPGYEVEVWSDGDGIHTHWTHCPPQAFVRSLVESEDDRGDLEAFRRSWCLYDWAGADLLVGDGERGHYARAHTMSAGDPVCDMCWWAGRPGGGLRAREGSVEPDSSGRGCARASRDGRMRATAKARPGTA